MVSVVTYKDSSNSNNNYNINSRNTKNIDSYYIYNHTYTVLSLCIGSGIFECMLALCIFECMLALCQQEKRGHTCTNVGGARGGWEKSQSEGVGDSEEEEYHYICPAG